MAAQPPGPTRSPGADPAAARDAARAAEAAFERLARWARSLVPDADRGSPGAPMRFGTALVAVDGSPASDLALSTALAWARHAGARLHLVTVVEDMPAPFGAGGGVALDLETDVRDAMRATLDERAATARGAGVEHEAHLEKGVASRVLIERAKEHGAHVIIMGSNTRGALDRFFVGSVSDAVQAHAEGPVLIVKDERAQAPRRILVAVDGSEPSLHAARWALHIATLVGAAVTVLHVDEGTRDRPDAVPQSYAQWKTQVAADFPRASVGGHPLVLELREGEPADEVIALAQDHDLLCLGARGISAPLALLVGSVSREALHEAPCSVLIVR